MDRSAPPPALSGVLETVLYVEDLEAADRFYVGLLGFRRLSAEAGRHLFLRAGGSVFLLFRPEESRRSTQVPPHGAAGPGHACFLVPRGAYEAWRAFLPGRGIEVVHDHAWPGGGRSFYFHDPGGNVLEIADRDFWP